MSSVSNRFDARASQGDSNLQYTEGEEDRNTESLPERHLQVPDNPLGEEQDDEIRGEVDGSGRDINVHLFKTAAGKRNVPDLLVRRADAAKSDDERNHGADLETDHAVADIQERVLGASGYEHSRPFRNDCDFNEWKGNRVENTGVMNVLFHVS